MKKRAFFAILPVFPALFCTSCMQKDERSDVESYIDILKECRDEADFHSELTIFPETIEGKEVKISNFGVFYNKARLARKGTNPSDGSPITIPANNTVGFRPSKTLKEKLN